MANNAGWTPEDWMKEKPEIALRELCLEIPMPTDPTHVRYVYKCRLCGEEYAKQIERQENVEQSALVLSVVNGISARLICTHKCPDGSIGIADLQGARVEKAQ